MEMTFSESENVQILFEKWKVTSVGGLIGSCIAVFVIAVLYECLKSNKSRQVKCDQKNSEASPLLYHSNGNQTRFVMKDHAKKTCYFFVQFIVGYFLMLVAMTYNVWLFLAIVLGCGTGYFFANPLIQLCCRMSSPSTVSVVL